MLKIECLTVNPFQENTWIVYEPNGDAVVFDPGFFSRVEEQAFVDLIQKNGLTLMGLINTHCHIDHILGNAFVSDKYSLPLQVSKGEWAVYEQNRLWGKTYGLECMPFEGDVNILNPESKLKIGSYEFEILSTPGHSPDHLSFYCAQAGILVSGDVLFEGSIGRTDLPGGDFAVLEQSIQKKLYILPDETLVLPGHGATTQIGIEKRSNPFVQAVL